MESSTLMTQTTPLKPVRILCDTSIDALQKKVNKLARKGYRVTSSSIAKVAVLSQTILIVMELPSDHETRIKLDKPA